MRSYSILCLVFLSTALANPQVNFYWDRNCQEYAGSSYPDVNSAQILGGPYGSQSALFVNTDGLPSGCDDLLIICGDAKCAAGDQTAVSVGQCVGQFTAVYATAGCAI